MRSEILPTYLGVCFNRIIPNFSRENLRETSINIPSIIVPIFFSDESFRDSTAWDNFFKTRLWSIISFLIGEMLGLVISGSKQRSP